MVTSERETGSISNPIRYCKRDTDIPSTPTRGEVEQAIGEALGRDMRLRRMDIGMLQEPYPAYAPKAIARANVEVKIAGYGPTEGLPGLRQQIAEFTSARFGLEIDPSWVVV